MPQRQNDAATAGLLDPNQDGRQCCLCGGTAFQLLHRWEPTHPRNSSKLALGFWECRCKLAFLHPVPGAAELPDQGDWWSTQRKAMFRHPRFKRHRARILNALFGTPLRRLIRQTRRAQPHGRLLDIGCGRGELLAEAASFYQCEGVEPSPIAADEARRRGFEITEGCFESTWIPSAGYDLATLDSVLEHVEDPADVLRKVNRILKPGGVVAVKVPKLWGPSHRRHGCEWNGYRLGYHLTMFCGQTLNAVLSAAGFEPLKRPRRDRSLDDILIVWGRKTREVREKGYRDAAAA